VTHVPRNEDVSLLPTAQAAASAHLWPGARSLDGMMCSCCKRPLLDPEAVMLTTLVIGNSPCGTTTPCLEAQIHTSQPSEPAIIVTLVKAVCSKRPTEVPRSAGDPQSRLNVQPVNANHTTA
jgi:hypothetical protein